MEEELMAWKLFQCEECRNYYYKKVDLCPYCNFETIVEIKGTMEEIILSAIKELYFETIIEHKKFSKEQIEEKIKEKLDKEFRSFDFNNALDKAIKKGYFTKISTYYVNS